MPYQDKQLKKEFIQVNGRTVPFGYPQFWNEDKDDWDISSKNNPLPTGDYGMTEGGVWIPKKVSDDGTTLTQVTGSIGEIFYNDSIMVTANANSAPIYLDILDYEYTSIVIGISENTSTNHDFGLDIARRIWGNRPLEGYVDNPHTASIDNDSRYVTDRIYDLAPMISFRLNNRSDEDRDYTISVTGFRGA